MPLKWGPGGCSTHTSRTHGHSLVTFTLFCFPIHRQSIVSAWRKGAARMEFTTHFVPRLLPSRNRQESYYPLQVGGKKSSDHVTPRADPSVRVARYPPRGNRAVQKPASWD